MIQLAKLGKMVFMNTVINQGIIKQVSYMPLTIKIMIMRLLTHLIEFLIEITLITRKDKFLDLKKMICLIIHTILSANLLLLAHFKQLIHFHKQINKSNKYTIRSIKIKSNGSFQPEITIKCTQNKKILGIV